MDANVIQARRARRSEYKSNRKIGMSIVNAAIAAGYPQSILAKRKKDLVASVPSTDFFTLFEQRRMTDRQKVDHVLEGMSATMTVSVQAFNEDGTPETTGRGRRVYRNVEIPDWRARHKYFETMLKMCKQLENPTTNVLMLGGEFAARLKKARQRASEEMKAKFGSGYVRDMEASVDAQYTPAPRADNKTLHVPAPAAQTTPRFGEVV